MAREPAADLGPVYADNNGGRRYQIDPAKHRVYLDPELTTAQRSDRRERRMERIPAVYGPPSYEPAPVLPPSPSPPPPPPPSRNGKTRFSAPDDDEQPVAVGAGMRLQQIRAMALTATQLDQLPPPRPLITDILYQDTINAIFGKPGVGKSFVALDWALSVATETWWLSHQVEQVPVIYIAAEGSAGLPLRKKAWEKARNVIVNDGWIVWLPAPINLLDPEWVEGLALYAAERDAGLVIIDTASRSMPGGDEGARDMNRLVDSMDLIRQASGACVLAVHHDTKAGEGTLRGHSSLEGAVNTTIFAQADGHNITLKNTKQKDAAEFEPIQLYLRPIADSCAIWCQTGVAPSDDVTESEAILIEALGTSAGTEGLTTGQLLDVAELPRRSFFRAKKSLEDRGLLINIGTTNRPRWQPRKDTTNE